MEAVTDFIFLDCKITVDGEYSYEMKTLTPWKENYDELRWCIKKQRYHFANRGLYNQGYGFSSSHLWMWELVHKKGWAPKGEHQRTDAFELCCWRRLLRAPWAEGRSNQSIWKEIIPDFHWKDWCWRFGLLMQRADSLEKTLMLGKIESERRKGQQRMRWLDSTTDSTDMNLMKFQETVEDRGAWHVAVHGVAESQTWLSNWATATVMWAEFPNLHQSLSI